ncbi:MAG: glycosyltransferase [Chitinophagaceae bacterium]
MIKVASLVPYQVIPAKMGGQKGIFLFLQYFSRYHPVICYTTKSNQPQGDENFAINNAIGNARLRYINPAYFFTLRRRFKKDNITHLIIEHPYYGWLGFLLKKFAGIKLIIHSHNIESLRFKSTGRWWWGVLWWYERFTHRIADGNFFISEEDKKYAIEKFELRPEKCCVITYGTEKSNIPSQEEKAIARKEVCSTHNIHENDLILLYNGTLNYPPNLKALDFIINELASSLERNAVLKYSIVICGNKLPAEYNNLSAYKKHKIIYAGFVKNIDVYFNAADIFLNPLTDGGGIKTKLVEALAANNSAVSFSNGAIGIPQRVTGNKLIVVQDGDLAEFELQVEKAAKTVNEKIPADFFIHFYWANIAQKAATFLETINDN